MKSDGKNAQYADQPTEKLNICDFSLLAFSVHISNILLQVSITFYIAAENTKHKVFIPKRDIKTPVNYDLWSEIIACHPHLDRQLDRVAAVIKIIQKQGQSSANMNSNTSERKAVLQQVKVFNEELSTLKMHCALVLSKRERIHHHLNTTLFPPPQVMPFKI